MNSIHDRIDELDEMLVSAICNDISNGTLLTKADDETVKLVLTGLWEHLDYFSDLGVIIGKA